MQLEYDLNVGALYIRLSDGEVARTREAGDNAAVDLDSTGGVVGIEVISVAHPWPLSDILAAYKVPDGEVAEIRAYFRPQEDTPMVQQESPKLGIAPTLVAA